MKFVYFEIRCNQPIIGQDCNCVYSHLYRRSYQTRTSHKMRTHHQTFKVASDLSTNTTLKPNSSRIGTRANHRRTIKSDPGIIIIPIHTTTSTPLPHQFHMHLYANVRLPSRSYSTGLIQLSLLFNFPKTLAPFHTSTWGSISRGGGATMISFLKRAAAWESRSSSSRN